MLNKVPLDDIDNYQKVETILRKVSGQPYSKVFRKVKGKIKALVEETTDEKAMFEEDFDSNWLEFQSAMKNVFCFFSGKKKDLKSSAD